MLVLISAEDFDSTVFREGVHKYTLGWRQAALSRAEVLDSERCRTHLSPLLYTSYNSHPEASHEPHISHAFKSQFE